jgi:predicted peroxiredoxin
MPVQRGLALVFAEANHARLHAGLSLAVSAAALGCPVRLFFHGESVAELLATALGLGLPVMACQSGLHLCGLSAATLAGGIEAGGMIAFLADAKTDELLVV